MIRYPLAALTREQLRRILGELTIPNGQFFQRRNRGLPVENVPEHFIAAHIDGDDLVLPRHVPWDLFQLNSPYLPAPSYESIDVEFGGTLRDDQIEPADVLTARTLNRQDGILSIHCGGGKTVLALYAWSKCHVPAVVVVPTLDLVGQWQKRVCEFTDCPPDRIGQIGDGHAEWADKWIVVSTIHSLAQKTFPAACYERFGVVFFDEVHRLGAPYFSTVGQKFYGTRIGLSATWKRTDGLEKLFQLHVGPVFYEDKKQPLKPDVYFIPTNLSMDLRKYRLWQQANLNFGKIVTALSRNEQRRNLVLSYVKAAYEQNRRVLVLGDRVEELVYYHDFCSTTLGMDTGLCVGSLDGHSLGADHRADALRRPVVFATSKLVKEGLDQAALDTLFVLYPQSNASFAEQSTGRILRKVEGKNQPIVGIFCDDGCYLTRERRMPDGTKRLETTYPFVSICQNMQRVFERLGYPIQQRAA